MNGAILWPIAVYGGLVALLTLAILVISHFLGERHNDRATGTEYESGVASTGDSRLRFGAHFYLVAVLFVIFDLEALFILAWAPVAREVGWLGYAEVGVFVALLAAALTYLWRSGALDFAPKGRRGGDR